jgi:hypothetical protein
MSALPSSYCRNVTPAGLAAEDSSSDLLYFGSLKYPSIWSLVILFTNSSSGSGRSDRLIHTVSYRLTLFF